MFVLNRGRRALFRREIGCAKSPFPSLLILIAVALTVTIMTAQNTQLHHDTISPFPKDLGPTSSFCAEVQMTVDIGSLCLVLFLWLCLSMVDRLRVFTYERVISWYSIPCPAVARSARMFSLVQIKEYHVRAWDSNAVSHFDFSRYLGPCRCRPANSGISSFMVSFQHRQGADLMPIISIISFSHVGNRWTVSLLLQVHAGNGFDLQNRAWRSFSLPLHA